MKMDESRIPNFDIPEFEELQNDGKQYCPFDELQTLNIMLQCHSKKGVILPGPSGIGKTALVQCFAQQNLNASLGLASVKVIHLKEQFFRKIKNYEELPKLLSTVMAKFDSSQLIVYANIKGISNLENVVDILNLSYEKLKMCNGLSFLKFIFEVSMTDKNEEPAIERAGGNTYYRLPLTVEKDLEQLTDIVSVQAEEFSNAWGISYTRDVLLFYVAITSGQYEGIDKLNLNNYINVIESAFVFSKMAGKSALEKDCAEALFKKCFNYLSKFSGQPVQTTAIHEAGHALIRLLYFDIDLLNYVSIVPGRNFNGVTVSKTTSNIPSMYKDRQYFINSIACSLAGRLAEKIIQNATPNSGAGADLRKADSIIDDMLYNYGFSEALGENAVVNKIEYLSETLKTKVEMERKFILETARVVATTAIAENAQFVKALADRLNKELVVSGNDVRKMWIEYTEGKKQK
ncbi:MAG: hypothetical protein IKD76_01875 [Clostridia bacterium]|nr:hypothetical protein [Clostridia bacterium]